MKQFFEQMIMDSVSAVKDELLSRLHESGNNIRNQEVIAKQKTDAPKLAPQNHPSIQPHNLSEKTNPKNFDGDEFPIIAYPDSDEKCPTEGHAENNNELKSHLNFSNLKDENSIREEYPKTSSNIGRHFFTNHENFSDGEHKISMLNAYNKNRRLNIMILGAVFGLVFCLLMLTFYKGDLPGEVVGIISTVSGIFGSCLKDAYSFEFGSSRGSKEKDDKITSTLLKQLKI